MLSFLSVGESSLSCSAVAVYSISVRGNWHTWYGPGQRGWYRYFDDNAGSVHFSGIVPEHRVPLDVRNHFAPKKNKQ